MSSLAHASLTFAFILGGILIGMLVRDRLPDHHLSDDSRQAVTMGTALIATMTALILGLLIASAKGHYDTMSSELDRVSLKIMQLDSVLAEYGSEAREARDVLRNGTINALQRVWPEEVKAGSLTKASHPSVSLTALRGKLIHLSPKSDVQRWLKARAVDVTIEIADTRWLLIQQSESSSLPMLARILLVFWLTFLFFSFGLFSPRNATVIVFLIICALSAAGSILLILELDQPMQGLIKLSSEPLRNALASLGQ